jgi:LytS/YehU family sensor histidine kinase
MGPEIFFKAAGEVVGLADFRQCFGYGPHLFSVGLPTCVNTGSDNDRSMTDATTTVCVDVFQLMTKALLYFRELFDYEQETKVVWIAAGTTNYECILVV